MKELLLELNEQQRAAVTYLEGPLVIFAGVGTGKTRVITYRIAYLISLGVEPYNILALTFTNKAAEEMKTRVTELVPHKGESVWMSTFHSFCARVLYTEAEKFGINKNFVIYDETDSIRLIKECLKEMSLIDVRISAGDIYDIISRAKDDMIDPESYKINSAVSHQPYRELIAEIYIRYQRKLQSLNAFDFGDLICKTVEFFKDEKFKDIKNKYAERFKYIHVDEYQDVNYAQVALLKLLTSKHHNICVVGDDDQTIYSWRGSNVNYLLNFKKDFSTADIKVKEFKLEQNYRSKKSILEIANTLISHNKQRAQKKVYSCIEGELEHDIKIKQLQDEYEEAQYVAEEILRLEKQIGNLTIGVFYRINAQSRMFEEVFRQYKIPYKLVGSYSFYERQEIKDIISYLRILVNPYDTLSLKRIINVPPRGIGETTVLYLETLAKENNTSLWEQMIKIDTTDLSLRAKNSVWKFLTLYDLLKRYKDTMYPSEFIKFLIEQTGYLQMIEETNRFENKIEKKQNLEELVSLAKEYERKEMINTVEEFLTKISLFTVADTQNVYEGRKNISSDVTLMTLHAAKGLEFDVVFITGLEEGILPIWWVTRKQNFFRSRYNILSPNDEQYQNYKTSDIEEERRLCYVGVTRARKFLYLTYTFRRYFFSNEIECLPSRFLDEMLKVYTKNVEVDKSSYFNKSTKSNNVITDVNMLRVGEYVVHDKFGIGKIVEIVREPENDKVVVLFRDGKQRKLSVQYAKLTKLGEKQ